jgi:1-acyl-sn-glycerol-3-phosphate acyltransferase
VNQYFFKTSVLLQGQKKSKRLYVFSLLRTLNLRTAVMWTWTFPWATVGIVAMILDPTGRLYSFLARRGWARQLLWLAGLNVKVKGAEAVDWKRHYIICANHQSQVDIPLLFACLPGGIRFMAKRVLFYVPIFGWMLAIAKFIPVDRGNREKAHKSISRGAKRIKKGPSLLVFPEGTRTLDGEVHEFKSGAFVMAIQSSVPILPVAIRGTFDVVPKGRLDAHPGPVEVIIGTPIPSENLTLKDKNDLRQKTFDAVVEMHRTGEPK